MVMNRSRPNTTDHDDVHSSRPIFQLVTDQGGKQIPIILHSGGAGDQTYIVKITTTRFSPRDTVENGKSRDNNLFGFVVDDHDHEHDQNRQIHLVPPITGHNSLVNHYENHNHRRLHPPTADRNSDVDDYHREDHSDKKFEEFINKVRNKTQQGGAFADDDTIITTNNNVSSKQVVALPLTSDWRRLSSSVPNSPRISKPITNNGGGAAKDDHHQFPKELGMMNNYNSNVAGKKKLGAPERIDSREATKRYGKLLSRTSMQEEEEYYQGIITSREAREKYKGAFVPRN